MRLMERGGQRSAPTNENGKMTTTGEVKEMTHQLANISTRSGARDEKTDNAFALGGIDHIAMCVTDLELMESFLREFMGGVPYYYAGFDETDRQLGRKRHLFVRIGHTLAQITEEKGPGTPQFDDNNIAPHWGFKTTVAGLDLNMERLKAAGIPFFGPASHRDIDVVSIYFMSPEGHKLEICTWDGYPPEKAKMMGAPGVGFINWKALKHNWPNNKN